MRQIKLEMDLDAPAEELFAVMADHARYDRFRPISSSEVLREGDENLNGVGAVRRLRAKLLRFDEEITAYEPPRRLDYLILNVNIPLHHEGGSIRFEPAGAGTHVVWTSAFRITVPLLGGPLGAAGAAALKRSFGQMLEDAARIAAAQA
ncbi:MAG: SRPBCC family protein [Actinomycetota bacterium]|nr:SRPBCC family protein [Actinomycetota bacterium]